MPEIYQLNNGLFIEEKHTGLGSYFVYSDYESDDKLDPAIMDCYVGNPVQKIPNRLWNQMVTFFMHYLSNGTEVECRYYYNAITNQFICLVADQVVGGASVGYDYTKPIYGLDGRSYTLQSLVAEGYVLFAHFHLHPFDMANPSGVDDKNEMDTPLLYGIVSIPSIKKSTMEYRIRTTIIANDSYKNRRYWVDSWDFIDLPTNSEIQTYTEIPYAPICEGQVKKFVPVAALPSYRPYRGAILPAQKYVYTPLTLEERITTALENIIKFNSIGATIESIEALLPKVIENMKKEDKLVSSYEDLYNDPFYYDSGV